jgi:hypothetical protein
VGWVRPKRGRLLTLAYYAFPRWYEFGERRWNDSDRGKPKTWEKNCPSATLSTTNPTRIDPGANPGFRGERPATNHLSHDTAYFLVISILHHSGVWLYSLLSLVTHTLYSCVRYAELHVSTDPATSSGLIANYTSGAACLMKIQSYYIWCNFRCYRCRQYNTENIKLLIIIISTYFGVPLCIGAVNLKFEMFQTSRTKSM